MRSRRCGALGRPYGRKMRVVPSGGGSVSGRANGRLAPIAVGSAGLHFSCRRSSWLWIRILRVGALGGLGALRALLLQPHYC